MERITLLGGGRGGAGVGGGAGRAKYKKNIRARKTSMKKKIHARQLTLTNIHATA